MHKVGFEWHGWQKIIVGLLIIFIIISGSIATFRYVTRVVSPMPKDIREQLTFSPLVIPASEKSIKTTDYKLAKAEDGTQILSYKITTKSGVGIAVTQNTQPPQFTEITEFKERFLTNVVRQYTTVQTSTGAIYLGRLAKQDNKQTAVILDKGLLVFFFPEKELNDTEWRKIGDTLEVEKITE